MGKYILIFIISIVTFIISISCKQKNQEEDTNFETKKTKIIATIFDSLNTEQEVEGFIRQTDSFLSKFELKKIADFRRIYSDNEDRDFATKTIAASQGVTESFYKADLDNNGFTDLLVIGDDNSCSSTAYENCNFSAILFMNFGQDSIQINKLNKDYGHYSFVPKFESIKGKDYLKIFSPNDYDVYDDSTNNYISTLTYKFNGLIEAGQSNDNLNIEQIEFSTGGCFGTCPVFTLKIDKERNAKFIAEHYNFSQEINDADFEKIEGKFHTTIKGKNYQEIISQHYKTVIL